MLNQSVENAARVLPVEDSLRSFFQDRDFRFSGSREFDISDLDSNIGYRIHDGIDRTIGLAQSHVLHVTRNGSLDQHGLKHVINLLRQSARERKLPVKQ